MTALARYEAVRTALAEAVRIDEVKDILDKSAAIEAYGRQAKDRQLEANAVELRERATRRLGQLLAEAKKAGRIKTGRPPRNNGTEPEPFFSRATLAKIGIDKKLSSQAQRKAALSDKDFEGRLNHMHLKVEEGRSPADAIRDKERDAYRANARDLARELSERTAELAATGRKFSVLYADAPWRRKAGFTDRSYENHFPTMTWAQIIGLPVKDRLLPDAWGFLWIPRAHLLALHPVEIDTPLGRTTVKMPLAWAVAHAWGFDAYSTCFVWTKTDDDHPDDMGSGLIVRDQDEILLLFKRGRGMPMPATDEKFGSNYRERSKPLGHSRKPEFYRDMIRTMVGAGVPVLELFARVDDEHPLPQDFYAWGNQSDPSAGQALPPEAAVGAIDEPFDPETGELIENEAAEGATGGSREIGSDADAPTPSSAASPTEVAVDGGKDAPPPVPESGAPESDGGDHDLAETPSTDTQVTRQDGAGEGVAAAPVPSAEAVRRYPGRIAYTSFDDACEAPYANIKTADGLVDPKEIDAAVADLLKHHPKIPRERITLNGQPLDVADPMAIPDFMRRKEES